MGIRASAPLPGWERNSAYFGASQFPYDAAHDRSVCPQGQILRRTHTPHAHAARRTHTSHAHVGGRPAHPVPGAGLDLPRLPAQSGLHARHEDGALGVALVRGGVPGACAGLPADRRLPEGAAQTPSLGRAAVCRGQRVAWLTPLPPAAAGQNLKRLLAHHGWGRRPVPSGAALALTLLDGVVAASLPLRCGVAWELFLIVGLTICPGAQERTLTQPR
jgi:hypothetical protein